MTAITAPAATSMTTARFLRAVAVAGLATAGAIHLILVPGHLESSPALAFGFLGAGWTQLALAVGLALGPGRRLLVLAILVSGLFLSVYVYDVTVGLPIASHAAVHSGTDSHAHAGAGHDAGAAAVDPLAIAAKSAEVLTLVAAGTLLTRPRREQHPASSPIEASAARTSGNISRS